MSCNLNVSMENTACLQGDGGVSRIIFVSKKQMDKISSTDQPIKIKVKMSKQPSIQIHDAQRRVNGKRVNGYRVKSVAKNGEILQTSEVLNTTSAVKKHLYAMANVWQSERFDLEVIDCTKGNVCKWASTFTLPSYFLIG